MARILPLSFSPAPETGSASNQNEGPGTMATSGQHSSVSDQVMTPPNGLRIHLFQGGLKVAEILEQALVSQGHQVGISPVGPEWLATLKENPPHIIVLDGAEAMDMVLAIRSWAPLFRPFLIAIVESHAKAAESIPGVDLVLGLPLDRAKFLGLFRRLADLVGFDPMI